MSAAKPQDAALRALAEVLAPFVAQILLKQQSADDGDQALAELLERAGYELAEEGGAQ